MKTRDQKSEVRSRIVRRAFLPAIIGLLLFAPSAQAATTAVTVTWTVSNRATGYRLGFGRTSHRYAQTVNAGAHTSLRVAGLTRGVTYYFAVKAYNSAGSSPYGIERKYRP